MKIYTYAISLGFPRLTYTSGKMWQDMKNREFFSPIINNGLINVYTRHEKLHYALCYGLVLVNFQGYVSSGCVWLFIRASSQYRDRLSRVWDSHAKDKTVARRSYL